MSRPIPLVLASLFAFALVACQKDEPGEAADAAIAAADSPTDVIKTSAKHLERNDLVTVVKLAVPPAQYATMQQRWRDQVKNEPPSQEERAEFAEMMAKLTAPDAEQALYAELEPQLAQFDAEMAQQMPLMIGMAQGFAMQQIQQNPDLSAEQRSHATDVVNGFAGWLSGVNLSDRERARQAIAHIVTTARAVELQTLEQVEALEFEQLLAKLGIVVGGLKDVLRVYDFDLDRTLTSVDPQIVSQDGDAAMVAVTYSLFDKPLSFQSEMVRIDDRWYGKQTIEQIQAELDSEAGGDADKDAVAEPAPG